MTTTLYKFVSNYNPFHDGGENKFSKWEVEDKILSAEEIGYYLAGLNSQGLLNKLYFKSGNRLEKIKLSKLNLKHCTVSQVNKLLYNEGIFNISALSDYLLSMTEFPDIYTQVDFYLHIRNNYVKEMNWSEEGKIGKYKGRTRIVYAMSLGILSVLSVLFFYFILGAMYYITLPITTLILISFNYKLYPLLEQKDLV